MGNPRSASEGAEEQQPQSLKEDAFHSGAGAGQGKDAAGDQADAVEAAGAGEDEDDEPDDELLEDDEPWASCFAAAL